MAQHIRFLWAWLTFHRRDVVAGAVLFAVLAVLGYFWFPRVEPVAGGGFGPDWQCTSVGSGEPVCIRKPAATNPAAPPS